MDRTFDPIVKSGLPRRSASLLEEELATPLDPVRRGRRGGEDAGYQSAVAAANGVQVRQVRISRNDEARLAQVVDAGDVVVVRVGGHASDYVLRQLFGDLSTMAMEPQKIVTDLVQRDVANLALNRA